MAVSVSELILEDIGVKFEVLGRSVVMAVFESFFCVCLRLALL